MLALKLTAEDDVAGLLERALSASQADETEALFFGSDGALTRFVDNAIHENMRERNCELRVRAVVGKRLGVASTNKLDDDSVRHAVERAFAIARVSAEDPAFPGLPTASGRLVELPHAWDEATAEAGASVRAGAVRDIAAVMHRHSLRAAGYVATRSDAVAVANTKGVRRFFRSSDSGINIKAIGETSSGYAEGYARRFADLSPATLAERAATKAVTSKNPVELGPGKYTVILEPPAFREFLGYLSWIGFGAQPFEEGSSFMSGRIGERIVGANVTMTDDFAHRLGDGIPFDFEGVPRQQVVLIERGIARQVVYDSYYAAKLAATNTGHALPAPNSEGPMPLSVVVSPGSASQEELVAGVERGVLVSRTWYIRLVDQKQTIITGMTRDGLFLIENGKVTRGLKNMRFNESIIGALGRCELGNALVRSESHVLPAAKIHDFPFTSGTEFG